MTGAFKSQPTFFRPISEAPEGGSETITVSGSHQESAVMPAGVVAVRIAFSGATGNAPCFFTIGAEPEVAADSGTMMNCPHTEYFKINPGEKISVMGTDGKFNITPVTK